MWALGKTELAVYLAIFLSLNSLHAEQSLSLENAPPEDVSRWRWECDRKLLAAVSWNLSIRISRSNLAALSADEETEAQEG